MHKEKEEDKIVRLERTLNMVSFKLFAGTNVGLRENNEDNFTVCPDLMNDEWIVPADNQQVVRLGARGCVMAVADGMGGQNAGEVASAIAIATVQELFSPNNFPADVLAKPDTIKSFLKKVISECDFRIKKRTEEDTRTAGMGSTIVVAWLIGGKLYIAWLGDSRAYSFVKNKGIARLSKDHSYVQQLVDAGAITDEEAMSHPNSNVITRSLGDTSQKAKADVAEYEIEDGQIVLLCSDGLCGVCRDEEIGGIIEDEMDCLQKCKEKLTTAALAAGGSDNITISLMQIKVDSTASVCSENKKNSSPFNMATVVVFIFGLCLLLSLLYAGSSLFRNEPTPVKSVKILLDSDTIEANGKTAFHIIVVGDSLLALDYDKDLITVNMIDSVITVKNKALQRDTTIYLKAICKQTPSLADSVRLVVKKEKQPLMQEHLSEVEEVVGKVFKGGGNGGTPSESTVEKGNLTPAGKGGPPEISRQEIKP